MPYTRDWSEVILADHTKFKQQPGGIRDARVDIAERLKNMFEGFTSGEVNERVKKLMFRAEAGDPLAIAAVLQLYGKVSAAKTEAFLRNEDGTIQQITYLSGLFIEALKMAGLVTGDLPKYDGTKITRFPRGTAGQFLRVNSGGTDLGYETVNLAANAPMGLFRNLKVTRPTVSTVTVTADELILQDASANTVRAASVNVTPNITLAGANGLDTGVEAASTLYYIWVIRKSSDGTVAGLLSLSSTAPTMPTGYDQKALVGAVRNDGASNFISFIQEGRRYNYSTWQSLASGNVGLGAWVSVSLAAFVPAALSTYVYGSFYTDSTTMVTNDNTVSLTTTVAAANRYLMTANFAQPRWELNVITADTIYWASNSTPGTLYLQGFELNKL